jgi:hypothetical protein
LGRALMAVVTAVPELDGIVVTAVPELGGAMEELGVDCVIAGGPST